MAVEEKISRDSIINFFPRHLLSFVVIQRAFGNVFNN